MMGLSPFVRGETLRRIERGKVALMLLLLTTVWSLLVEGAARWPGVLLLGIPALALTTSLLPLRRPPVLRVLDEEPERIVGTTSSTVTASGATSPRP